MIVADMIPFFLATQVKLNSLSNPSRDWQTIYYFTTSFVLSLPLLLEFVLDTILSSVYPAYGRNISEHRLGHFAVLLSLALPLVIVLGNINSEDQTVFNPLFDKCFTNACQCLALTGIFGTLQYIDKKNWNLANSSLIVLLFFGSQLSVNLSIEDCDGPHHCQLNLPAATISVVLIILSMITHTVVSIKQTKQMCRWLFWSETQPVRLTSDQVTSAILSGMVAIYLALRMCLSCSALAHYLEYNLVGATTLTLLTSIIPALIAVLLPNRMIRKDVVALKVCIHCYYVLLVVFSDYYPGCSMRWTLRRPSFGTSPTRFARP